MPAHPANHPPSFPEPPALPATFPPPPQTSTRSLPQELPPPSPAGPAPPAEPATPRQSFGKNLSQWLEESGSLAWFSSAIVHAALLIILSLFLLSAPSKESLWVSGGFDAPMEEEIEMDLSEIPLDPATPSLGPFENSDEIAMPGPRSDSLGAPTGQATTPQLGSPLAANSSLAAAATGESASPFETLANPLASRGGGMEGRNLANRRAAALAGGGTAQSEAAVEAALRWFAEHQWPDGGWRFDLEECPTCKGYCRDSGTHKSSTAATGLALLCYLGAGYTHEEGKYQEVVSRGLYYLQERMTITSFGGDLRDKGADREMAVPAGGLLAGINLAAAQRDTMYSQGIASLALTEAYAMTRDRSLREPAELAVKFIINAQYDDGGWRYTPRFEVPMGGDATVSGWQIAVLKSASLAGIDVPYEVWMKISDFLDSIQLDGGSRYLYVQGDSPNRRTAASAIGLLCRMIGGWPKEHRPLQQGAARLDGQLRDVYTNYYTSQVLHHLGGPNWMKWNPRMRDALVKSQSKDGHEAGSWYFAESHSSSGGRLYTTAMATMTLEVYYRYMPLYKETFVDRAPLGAVEVEAEADE